MTDRVSLVVQTDTAPVVPFPIPGATEGGVHATLVNTDIGSGIVTTIIHIVE